MQNILFATDGSAASKVAEVMAASLLDAYPQAKLTILHVIKPVYAGDGLGFSIQLENDALEQLAEEVKQETNQAFERYEKRVQFVTESGPPATVICEVADREGTDLIVVGSHGRGAVDRLLLGSVSQGVLHRAKMSVLVVK